MKLHNQKTEPGRLLRQKVRNNMKTILELAKENNINKVCIDGEVCDIRQLNKQPFKIAPIKTDIMKNTIFYEPMLFAWTK